MEFKVQVANGVFTIEESAILKGLAWLSFSTDGLAPELTPSQLRKLAVQCEYAADVLES